MKKQPISVIRFIFIFSSFLLIVNCASVKLSDSWTSDKFEDTKSKKILVIGRSDDSETRKQYEDLLVQKLKSENVNAFASNQLFPDLREKENLSDEEKNSIVQKFASNGIEGIVLIALKDTKVTYVDENLSPKSDQMTYNKGRYGLSFADYYNVHSIEYLSKDIVRGNVENLSTTKENPSYSTYILEVVVYDITLDKTEQLVGAYEVEAKEPKSAEQVLNNFTKIISKQFKK
ncbi:hypothetical protein [Winogradskyella flava]|uniref:hypothetical protein n=1 Tax=Winogradskyella flava TaxID=1884876 RepID=UPI00249145F6|nr:hypothetical protein [Winogradskyella flava]